MSTRERVWAWDAEGTFHPRYDAQASAEGLTYYCEIKGPFCGYDKEGEQSWADFLSAGPPAGIQMPPSIAEEIRAYALARTRT